MRQLVVSKNYLFFYFLVFGYLFGVIFYDFLGFDFTDELMAFFLVLFAGVTVWERKDIKQLKPLFWLALVFLFYICYSFTIKSNVPRAILMDAVIQIKPFLAFFCAYIIAPSLTKQQRLLISLLCVIIACFMIVVVMTGNIWLFFGHPSRLATSATLTALLYLYSSHFKLLDLFVFIVLLSVGLLSTRSKFYGFWAIALFLSIYFQTGGKIRFNVKTILLLVVLTILSIYLSWDKLLLYYVDGAMNSQMMWSRPAMMLTALLILSDYFPFGCGLGSFGTYASAMYYSKIYEEYGINHLWGLSKEKSNFITDAFYPELAQFGIVGVILYFGFWFWISYKGWSLQSTNPKYFLLLLLIVIFFLIEGIADATFTHNRGMFALILLGIILPNDNSYTHE